MIFPASLFRRNFLRSAFTAIFFVAALCGPGSRARASRIPASKHAGIVQAIDYQTKTITFQPDQNGKVLHLTWYWDTTFLADGKHVQADALKIGTQVKVEYHTPFLGHEYISQIEWSTNASQPAR